LSRREKKKKNPNVEGKDATQKVCVPHTR
jgi:hypothetical protein